MLEYYAHKGIALTVLFAFYAFFGWWFFAIFFGMVVVHQAWFRVRHGHWQANPYYQERDH